MSALFNVVLPVALIVAVGVIAGRRLPIDVASLTKLTLYVFAPALAADAMYRAKLGAEDAIRIFLAFSLATFALSLFSRLVAQVSGLDVSGRKSLIATTIFPNSGNFGLSLTLLALGQEGLERGFVTFAASALSGATQTTSGLLALVDDARDESDETVVVQLGGLADGTGGRASLAAPTALTITLTDDDATPVVTAGQTFPLSENAANGTAVAAVSASTRTPPFI